MQEIVPERFPPCLPPRLPAERPRTIAVDAALDAHVPCPVLVLFRRGRDGGDGMNWSREGARKPMKSLNRTSCAGRRLPGISANATKSAPKRRRAREVFRVVCAFCFLRITGRAGMIGCDGHGRPATVIGQFMAIDEGLRSELSKQGIFTTKLEELYNWGRKNSVWPLQFGLACCAIEMIATTMARYDLARFGAEVFRPSPRQADLMIVAGTVTKKMAPQVVRLYNQMPEPKYVIAMGACAISGGPFKQGYNVLKGIDRYLPVDVHIPGCPPRPEALIHAFMTLQKKIEQEHLSGPGQPRHLDPEAPSEFPIPVFGEHDLDPPKNPEVWQPPTLVR